MSDQPVFVKTQSSNNVDIKIVQKNNEINLNILYFSKKKSISLKNCSSF